MCRLNGLKLCRLFEPRAEFYLEKFFIEKDVRYLEARTKLFLYLIACNSDSIKHGYTYT